MRNPVFLARDMGRSSRTVLRALMSLDVFINISRSGNVGAGSLLPAEQPVVRSDQTLVKISGCW